MTLDQFNQQLSDMENTLLGYYKQKTLLVAAREGLRFQYITVNRAAWSKLLGLMFQQGFQQNDSGGVDLLGSIVQFIQSNIPMTDVNGNPSTDWLGINPGSPGGGGGSGVSSAGFLSPIENILSKPFFDATNPNQNPAYIVYGPDYWSNPTDWILNPSRVDVLDRQGIAGGGNLPFTIPPTAEWLANFYIGNPNHLAYVTSYPYMASVISANYTGVGTIQNVIQGFRDSLSQIISKTQSLIQLQTKIDSAVSDLTNFVSSYAAFGSSIDVAQVLLDLQNAASNASAPVPPPAPAQPEVLSQDPQPITAPPAPSSKIPLIIGGILIAALTMGNKK